MQLSLKIFTGICLTVLLSGSATAGSYDYLYKGLPFKMGKPEMPVFKKNVVSVADCGGKGNGLYLNTDAFRKAVETLEKRGGGKLLVPPGVWFTGPIELKSNINLHLTKGALLLFSPDFDLYPIVDTWFEGLKTRRCQSPVSARNAVNIAITGEGSINGSGEAWRPLKKYKVPELYWKKVVASGGVLKDSGYWFPSVGSLKGESISDMNVPRGELNDAEWKEIRDFLRPALVSLISCKNVFLQGVLFENSPSWNIHPLMCENLIVDGITVRNPSFAQNGDGIDVESCKNVLLVNSMFDVGDDAICIKSGKDEQGRKRGMPTENMIVDNCKVFKGHGGFVVGSEMSGGVRNIQVKNCQFLGTDVGLRFKSNRGRGGLVENIYIENIYMFDIATESFLFDLYYTNKSADTTGEVPAVTEATPSFRNIYVNNIVSRNANRAMYFNGLPEMKISNIHVENVFISGRYGAEISQSTGIHFRNVHLDPSEGPAIILSDVQHFEGSGLYLPANREKVQIRGNTTDVSLPFPIGSLSQTKSLK